MFRSWKLGTAFGIGLFVHWSFLLAPALVFYSNLDNGLYAALLSVGIALAVFGCVLLHELGHALMARVFGIPTRDITLYPIGGVARLERISEHPGEEVAIAVAGPAVNVAIAGGLWAGLKLAGVPIWGVLASLSSAPFPLALLVSLLVLNVGLVVFNMLPIFPMDGGRVLRALLSMGLGRLRGTEIAATVGMVMAGLMALAGLTGYGAPTLVLVGAFVFFAAQQERMMVRHQEYQRRTAPFRPFAEFPVDLIDPSALPTEPHFSGFTFDRYSRLWIEWSDGQPVAAVPVEAVGHF
jgi:Zn-dependent protease